MYFNVKSLDSFNKWITFDELSPTDKIVSVTGNSTLKITIPLAPLPLPEYADLPPAPPRPTLPLPPPPPLLEPPPPPPPA